MELYQCYVTHAGRRDLAIAVQAPTSTEAAEIAASRCYRSRDMFGPEDFIVSVDGVEYRVSGHVTSHFSASKA